MKDKFEKFVKSKFCLEIYSREKLIFRSKKEGIQGILKFIKKQKKFPKNLIIFDKKIGNAVALLLVYIKAKEVWGVVGSKLAKKTFKKFDIKFYFLKTIPNILNKNGIDICPLEKLSFLKTPREFYELVKNSIKYNGKTII